ncbi:MAG: Ig-like domain-containing protein [Candidatus Thermoplasmatota archaeon]|nr:Ig-like domain-containing protein [Candidatus Thermoplasmatota archaeon]
MHGTRYSSITALLVLTALVLAVVPFSPLQAEVDGDSPLPLLDAHIAGTLVNGTAGMHVEIKIIVDLTPTEFQDPWNTKPKYFNGSTDSSGSFNITVDSNSTTDPKEYLFNSKYMISVPPTYYLGMTTGSYFVPHYISSGETYHIPYKGLEAFTEDIGNLTLRIMNASGGTPIQNAVVTIKHINHPLTPPFELSKLTDVKGEATWTDVRTVNTSLEAKKLHFQDLSTTEPKNYVIVHKGGTTLVTFDLTEDPWPFTTDPIDGAYDVNVSNGIKVDFGTVMDRASITDPSNYRLSTDGTTPLPISLTPAPDDRTVSIVMTEDLAYDTNHFLRLDTSLQTKGGGRPLWRAMEVRFRTELPPGSVSGRLVDSITGEGAWGAKLLLSDQRLTANETGHFRFPLVPKGTYRLEVLDSYLFNATSIPGISVAKGTSSELGSLPVDPKPRGSLEVTIVSEAGAIPGATVKVLSSLLNDDELNMTTGPDGKVLFPRVRAGNVNLKGSALRHSSRIDIAIVKAGKMNEFTLRLIADPLPVTVTPTLPLGNGLVDPDTDLIISVPEEIKFQSLDVKLWTLDGSGERDAIIELAAPTKGSEALTYVVNIPGKLPMETGFELVIDDALQALDDLAPVLWRDLVYGFRTPDHPLSYVRGSVLLEGKPYKDLVLTLGPFSGRTDASGAFNITVDLSTASVSHTLRTNLSGMGYQDVLKELTFTAGKIIEAGTTVLYLIPGWYSVTPGGGMTGAEPGTNITYSFAEPVMDPGDGWGKLLKVIPSGSSAPVNGAHTVSADNRTIVFDPANDLTEGEAYRIEVSNNLLLRSGGPVLPVGNITLFTVRPPALLVTLKGPADSQLSSMPLDGIIKLEFSTRVNITLLVASLQITPLPTGIRYDWPSSSELWVSALYRSGQSFELGLPVGQYGTGGEPLRTSFSLDYRIGSNYSLSHAPESFQMLPEMNWVKGSQVRITGSSPNSIGYEVVVTVMKGGSSVVHSTTVLPDGSFNLTFDAPDVTGDHQVIVAIGIPGGPAAYERTYDVKVKSEQGQDGDDGLDPLMIAIAVVLILIILAIMVGGFLYMRAQRRRLEERPDIDYSDVDADWADEE